MCYINSRSSNTQTVSLNSFVFFYLSIKIESEEDANMPGPTRPHVFVLPPDSYNAKFTPFLLPLSQKPKHFSVVLCSDNVCFSQSPTRSKSLTQCYVLLIDHQLRSFFS